MTSLAKAMLARIAANGPITVADYMAECLMHPTMGYYATRDPFGASGDFVTAPEISQMYGEMLGLCLAKMWLDQGGPQNIVLAELGPGRGTLMADLLRAAGKVPGFAEAVSVHLVEQSPTLMDAQKQHVPHATWHKTVDTLPDGPLFLIANEFFDALPIRQFIRDGDGWREKMVGEDQGQLQFGLSAPAPIDALVHRLDDTKDGDLVEMAIGLPSIVSEIADRIERFGGGALIVDYGDWTSLGDTLQAIKAHNRADSLAAPGESDLTAHVDFAEITRHATGVNTTRLTPQGIFLERLGITARAQALAKTLQGKALEAHITAHRRLTHPDEMGNLFKVIGLFPKKGPPPPGLNA